MTAHSPEHVLGPKHRHSKGWRYCNDCPHTVHEKCGRVAVNCECMYTPKDIELRRAVGTSGVGKRSVEKLRKMKVTKTRPARDCMCGCGEQTGGGRFRPGHDSKLKSMLVTQAREGNKKQKQEATERLIELGWESYI